MRSWIVTSLLLLPLPALAEGWEATFVPAAAASWLATPDSAVIVVGAGPMSPELSAVAAALVDALRASGKTRLVMDAASLGDVSGLDDARVVERTRGLPVDEVLVVRLYTAATPTAVVSLYGKDGGSHGGYSATPGVAIAARATSGTGVAESAARALEEAERETAPPPRSSYDDLFVDFEDVFSVQASGTNVTVTKGIAPVQGRHKKPLDGASFYEVVGHPELAAKYRRSVAWQWGLGIGGAALMVGGLAYMVAGIADSPICTRSQLASTVGGDGSGCDDDNTLHYAIGGGAAGLGGILMLVGMTLDPHPVDASGARQLADEYNRKLRGRASLREPGLQLRADLLGVRGGGGLALSGSF